MRASSPGAVPRAVHPDFWPPGAGGATTVTCVGIGPGWPGSVQGKSARKPNYFNVVQVVQGVFNSEGREIESTRPLTARRPASARATRQAGFVLRNLDTLDHIDPISLFDGFTLDQNRHPRSRTENRIDRPAPCRPAAQVCKCRRNRACYASQSTEPPM